MLIVLSIYILGIIATLWIAYRTIDSGREITIADLGWAIILSLFSWVAFILILLIEYKDYVVFKKK